MTNLKGAMKRFFRSNENVSEENKERKEKIRSLSSLATFGQKVKTTWQSRSVKHKSTSESDSNTNVSQQVSSSKKLGSHGRSVSLSTLNKKSSNPVDLTAINEACPEDVTAQIQTDDSGVEEGDDTATDKSLELVEPFRKFGYSQEQNHHHLLQKRNVVMGVRAAREQYLKKESLTEIKAIYKDDSNKENQRTTIVAVANEPSSPPTKFHSPLSKCMASFAFLDERENNLSWEKEMTNHYPLRVPVPTPRKSRTRNASTAATEKPVPKPRKLPTFYWRSKHKLI